MAYELLIVSLITMARISICVLFVRMLIRPSQFNWKWKIGILVLAVFAFLPIPIRRLLQ
jgi:hypothetical protein